jgi:hypothetical protein
MYIHTHTRVPTKKERHTYTYIHTYIHIHTHTYIHTRADKKSLQFVTKQADWDVLTPHLFQELSHLSDSFLSSSWPFYNELCCCCCCCCCRDYIFKSELWLFKSKADVAWRSDQETKLWFSQEIFQYPRISG